MIIIYICSTTERNSKPKKKKEVEIIREKEKKQKRLEELQIRFNIYYLYI